MSYRQEGKHDLHCHALGRPLAVSLRPELPCLGRRRPHLLGIFCLAVLLLFGAAYPRAVVQAEGLSPKVSAALQQRGDLTLRDTTLQQSLYTIGEIWNINMVLGGQIEGTINGTFRDAPLYDILDSILLVNGYGYRPVGDSLVIVPLADLGTSNPMFESETISLKHASVSEVIPALESLRSRNGVLQGIASANSLTVVDYPHHVAAIRNAAQQIDAVAGKSTHVAGDRVITDILNYHPEYIDAKSLLEAIQSLVTADGRAAVVEQENQVIVIDRPENLQKIERILKSMDVPKPQVRITALIYDVDLDDVERMGVNWQNAFKGRIDSDGEAKNLIGIESAVAIPAAAGDPSGIMTFRTLSSGFDLTAVVDFLRKSDDSRLLADPNVVVVDRQKANIQIVTEHPYQQLTQTTGGGDIGTTAFREAGVMLNVTPRIAADGTIEMDVTPSFSRLTGYSEGPNPQPIIDRRETSTTVRVANGQVLVIGGLRQRIDIYRNNGIPYLKDLKYIGNLFRFRSTSVQESELVVFLKTEIMPAPMVCRHEDSYLEGMTKLESIPTASQFPWPKMSPPAPGVRESAFGPDPRRQLLPADMQPGVEYLPENHPMFGEEIAPPAEAIPLRESHRPQRLPVVR